MQILWNQVPRSSAMEVWTDISSSTSFDPTERTMLWALILGFIIAFILAFAVGGNDVANSFGTTVGANVLTLKSACILASIFETLGAVLIGSKVGETIRKGIIDVSIYNTSEYGRELLMVGEVSAMSGSAIWQLIATVFGLPVSGTHSIVGSCIGFSMVAVGSTGIIWRKLGYIVASWFASPIFAGFLSVFLFWVLNQFILQKENPLINGLRFLPFFYAFTLGINGFSILYSGAPVLGLNHLPFWAILLITLFVMIVTGVVVHFVAVPRVRSQALKGGGDPSLCDIELAVKNDPGVLIEMQKCGNGKMNDSEQTSQEINPSRDDDKNIIDTNVNCEEYLLKSRQGENKQHADLDNVEPNEVPELSYDGDDSDSAFEEKQALSCKSNNLRKSRSLDLRKNNNNNNEIDDDDDEDPSTVRPLFSFLQIITACFGSFAHGGNDVSNAIGPLIALWLIYHSGSVVQRAATPWYLLLYGGAGIVIGLWILGRTVIQTIGKNLTKITPSSGFCIELMTAFTVLVASNIGIPVSTTHCKVGAVVSIGWFRSRTAVQWSMVRNIALAWFITLPVSGLISAGVMYLLMNFAV